MNDKNEFSHEVSTDDALRISQKYRLQVKSEEVCGRCSGPNMANGRWAAASPLWNAVMRGGSIDGEWKYNEIICPLCFAEIAEEQEIATDWRIDAGTVNVELETVTPTGRVWNAQTWLWQEPDSQAPQPNKSEGYVPVAEADSGESGYSNSTVMDHPYTELGTVCSVCGLEDDDHEF